MKLDPLWNLVERRVASKIIAPYLVLIFVLAQFSAFMSTEMANTAYRQGLADADVRGCTLASVCQPAAGNESKIVYEMSRQVVLAFGAVTYFILLFGVWVARGIARPLVVLARAAEQAAKGDLPPPLPATRKDEIGSLTRSFNTIVEQLRRHQEA